MDSSDGDDKEPIHIKSPNFPASCRLSNGAASPPGSWFEIRLFYVRVSPCVIEAVPSHLTCRFRREAGASLEINGSRVPAGDSASLFLRRDRLDTELSEVTYVSTDSVRVAGAVEFQVYEESDFVLCGSLERVESQWRNGFEGRALENDPKTGWAMDCYSSASLLANGSAFIEPKVGISSPSIEVYVAGCCLGFPLILTKTIHPSSRRKQARLGALDAIPENEGTGRGENGVNGMLRHRNLQVSEGETDDNYESESESGVQNFYSPEGSYYDDDGQLSWFNAGVRVGVGIGLGMCLGIGIGVGLLMRSYQATSRTFKRRFL